MYWQQSLDSFDFNDQVIGDQKIGTKTGSQSKPTIHNRYGRLVPEWNICPFQFQAKPRQVS